MGSSDFKLNPEMRLGPVSIRVKHLTSTLEFYEKELGLTAVRKNGNIVELSPGSGKPPILLLKHVPEAETPPDDSAGLYHYALLLPDRKSLAAAYLSIGNSGIIFDGTADHLVSEALYLADPEGNGIEIYADRPKSEWKFEEDGQVSMATQPLDIDSLLKEVAGAPRDSLRSLPEETRVGHIHLKVTDLQRSVTFYRTVLGLDLMQYWGSAAFLSVGRYHHHIGMNTWESLGGSAVGKNWRGLENFAVTLPADNLNELRQITADSPYAAEEDGRLFLTDPDGIELVFKA